MLFCIYIHLKFVSKLNKVVTQTFVVFQRCLGSGWNAPTKAASWRKTVFDDGLKTLPCVSALLSVKWRLFRQAAGKGNAVCLEAALMQILFPAGVQLFSTTCPSNSNGSALSIPSWWTASWELSQQLDSFYQSLELLTYGSQPSHHKQDDSPRSGGGGIRKQNPETNSNYGALDFCSKAE